MIATEIANEIEIKISGVMKSRDVTGKFKEDVCKVLASRESIEIGDTFKTSLATYCVLYYDKGRFSDKLEIRRVADHSYLYS